MGHKESRGTYSRLCSPWHNNEDTVGTMADNIEAATAAIEREWSIPNGFFYLLRQGEYHSERVPVIQQILDSVQVSEDDCLPRRFVGLTWWIPTFMEWQMDRVREAGGDVGELKRDIQRLQAALDRILGVP